MHDGFAIALAWPETFCKQPGSWYDPLMLRLGFNQKGYYQVGHAAIVLVASSGRCSYFDFGRYHAPHGHGRVRSEVTDHELKLKSKAKFNDEKTGILNLEELLQELSSNPSTHGTGTIHANVARIEFESSLNAILKLQAHDSIPYGPFIKKGTNCSRFVSTAIQAGAPGLGIILKLRSTVTFTATPMSNIRALGSKSRSVVGVQEVEESCTVQVHTRPLST